MGINKRNEESFVTLKCLMRYDHKIKTQVEVTASNPENKILISNISLALIFCSMKKDTINKVAPLKISPMNLILLNLM
ncbi:MAG: hypothetical protein V4700_04345 [Pseudomonadota bacterium]